MTSPTLLITGASRGLGAAVARIAAGLGAHVVVSGRTAGALARLVAGIEADGGQALAVPADVSQADDCQFLVKQSLGHFGRIDALVNNAGVIAPIAAIANGDPVAWQYNLVVNVLGPMVLTRAALPALRQSRGRVINVSSGAASHAVAGWGAYCAAKGALNQFNRVLAVEEPSVTAIAVRPGVVDTAMQAAIRQDGQTGMPAGEHRRFVQYHEQGELLPPELPGRVLALLALYAPREWSGEFLSWNDEKVSALERGLAN